jgi:chemotaxis protein MotB
VTRHTDAIPFRAGSERDNWQLSSDRANASRRALIEAGLPVERIARVVGKADTEPLDPQHPDAAQNRRISIVLLRQELAAPATITGR